MRRSVVPIAPLLLTAACHQSQGGAVRAQYDNKAAAIDQQAEAQPNPTAKKIYQARAAAIRQEGKDREIGLKGGTPSSGPDSGANGH